MGRGTRGVCQALTDSGSPTRDIARGHDREREGRENDDARPLQPTAIFDSAAHPLGWLLAGVIMAITIIGIPWHFIRMARASSLAMISVGLGPGQVRRGAQQQYYTRSFGARTLTTTPRRGRPGRQIILLVQRNGHEISFLNGQSAFTIGGTHRHEMHRSSPAGRARGTRWHHPIGRPSFNPRRIP